MCLRSLSCCRTHGLYSLRSRANGRTLTFRVFWSTAEFFVLFPVGMILTHLPKRSLFHMGHDGFLYHEHLHLKSAFCLYLKHLRVTNMQKKRKNRGRETLFQTTEYFQHESISLTRYTWVPPRLVGTHSDRSSLHTPGLQNLPHHTGTLTQHPQQR